MKFIKTFLKVMVTILAWYIGVFAIVYGMEVIPFTFPSYDCKEAVEMTIYYIWTGIAIAGGIELIGNVNILHFITTKED